MEELKLENVEFVENKDVPLDVRIKVRLDELKNIREQAIEQLKIQQTNVLAPLNAIIGELSALLLEEDKNV